MSLIDRGKVPVDGVGGTSRPPFHHYDLNYTPPDTESGRCLAHR
jgi:hypothetical protein